MSAAAYFERLSRTARSPLVRERARVWAERAAEDQKRPRRAPPPITRALATHKRVAAATEHLDTHRRPSDVLHKHGVRIDP